MINRKNKKKGFTLVELLVVIAILAILASVSVVGYLGFTQNARESKAVTELTQYKTMLVAGLADGEEVIEGYTFTMTEPNKVVVKKGAENATTSEELDKALEKYFELSKQDGSVIDAEIASDGTLTSIVYKIESAKATWTLATDEIVGSK
ncbi:MAG: type II secretion system protein [Bacilli bacterium]|nr:type II secretion system protein [Bacilli bacterium]